MIANIPVSFFAGVERRLLLHGGGIRKAIQAGDIVIDPEVDENQLQPATLDVRIGMVRVYDQDAMAKTAEVQNRRVLGGAEPTTEFATVIPDEADVPIDIPPRSFAEIFLLDSIDFDSERYQISFDLRSTFGRFGLQMANPNFDVEDGRRYLSVWNKNFNTLRLYGHDRFAQIFFHPTSEDVPYDGNVVSDSGEARALASKVCDSPKMMGPYLMFCIGEEVLKFRRGLGVIDTREEYPKQNLFEICRTSEPVVHNPWETVIVQLEPRVNLPGDVGIKILYHIPYLQEQGLIKPDDGIASLESHRARATWVDPGYCGLLTAHPDRMKFPGVLERGQPFVLGRFFRYKTPVGNSYGGEGLGSQYQNSESGNPKG